MLKRDTLLLAYQALVEHWETRAPKEHVRDAIRDVRKEVLARRGRHQPRREGRQT